MPWGSGHSLGPLTASPSLVAHPLAPGTGSAQGSEAAEWASRGAHYGPQPMAAWLKSPWPAGSTSCWARVPTRREYCSEPKTLWRHLFHLPFTLVSYQRCWETRVLPGPGTYGSTRHSTRMDVPIYHSGGLAQRRSPESAWSGRKVARTIWGWVGSPGQRLWKQ